MDAERWYTVEELGRRWSLNPEVVRRMIRRQELQVLDLGPRRGYRVSEGEVEWFEGQRMKARRPADDAPREGVREEVG
jgi:hypothetical protein